MALMCVMYNIATAWQLASSITATGNCPINFLVFAAVKGSI